MESLCLATGISQTRPGESLNQRDRKVQPRFWDKSNRFWSLVGFDGIMGNNREVEGESKVSSFGDRVKPFTWW